MDNTWDPSEYGQKDVDEKVLIAASLHEDAEGGKDDSCNKFENVAKCKGHVCLSV